MDLQLQRDNMPFSRRIQSISSVPNYIPRKAGVYPVLVVRTQIYFCRSFEWQRRTDVLADGVQNRCNPQKGFRGSVAVSVQLLIGSTDGEEVGTYANPSITQELHPDPNTVLWDWIHLQCRCRGEKQTSVCRAWDSPMYEI